MNIRSLPKYLRAHTVFVVLLLLVTACEPASTEQVQDEADPGATQTAQALDSLAENTIEALNALDETATVAALTAQPTATQPPPTVTRTITPTPTLEFVEVEVSLSTNCRTGPNIAFDYVGALLVGERTQVVARTDVPGYFIVNNPDRPGQTCWLWDRHATIYGDPTRLPMVESPPTPTPSPASVAGWVFIDTNSNGKHDDSEKDDGISGVKLVLLVGSCPGGTVGYSTQSDSSGRYQFPVVLAANYCLTTEPTSSSLHPSRYSLSLNSGDNRDGFNFWRTP
jgi:hypothetical protein